MNVFAPQASDRLLDVGFSDPECSAQDNYLERRYPYPSNITALGISGNKEFSKKYPHVRVVLYDGKTFPFPDHAFDIGWSNAVIEHVGNTELQLFFLKELIRTCKQVYLTTPNKYFPIELHTHIPFLHWLPKPMFDSIISKTSKRWATGNYMHLLSLRQIKHILKLAGSHQYFIKKNWFFGSVMDFSIVIHRGY